MSAKRQKLMRLIEQGEFKEARRFVRTLNHPKQVELLRRVDIAEEKFQHRTASRRENLELIERLIDKGHFEKARRFVYALNHPQKTELLLKIEDKRQTDTMKAIVIGKKIENEPAHPQDLLAQHPFGLLGKPISFLMGLRVIEVLRNYQRMERSHWMWVGAMIYFTVFTLFTLFLLASAIRILHHATSPEDIVIVMITLLLLTLSPYLVALTQTRAYHHWYHDFKTS